MSKLKIIVLLSLLFGFFACSEQTSAPAEIPALGEISFDDWKIESRDEDKHILEISPKGEYPDSLIIDSLVALGNAELYFAADADLVDPQLGKKMEAGAAISVADTNAFSIVILDEKSRVLCVWLVTWENPSMNASGESSSSEKSSSSSEENLESSSSSESKEESSSSEKNSSSVEVSSSSAELVQSSSSVAESSSSEELVESSSSLELSSSSLSSSSLNTNIRLSDLSVENGTINVEGNKVYVEVPYGTNLSAIKLNPLDSLNDLRSSVAMEFEDESGDLNTYNVIAGVQLPGTTFDARESSFWATTSDAMATEVDGGFLGISAKSSANLSFGSSKATLTSKLIEASWTIIPGSWKLAGGFYFTGSYSASDALHIYHQGYTSGTPSTDASDISADMTFGKNFTARPTAFELTYSYTHVANENTTYPQKSLVYVILVSKDKKAIALGMLSDNSTVSSSTKKVELSYGSDPQGILTAGYAGTSDLTLGTGTEEVASIRVMFASSAYAHVVAGGAAGNSDKYRGGENSELVLDNFKLIY